MMLYEITYLYGNEPAGFFINLKAPETAHAWHWAACHAGLARIPGAGWANEAFLTQARAEALGISAVHIRHAGPRPAALGLPAGAGPGPGAAQPAQLQP